MAGMWLIVPYFSWILAAQSQRINIGVLGDVDLQQEVAHALSAMNDEPSASPARFNLVMVTMQHSEDAYGIASDVCRLMSQEVIGMWILSGSCQSLAIISPLFTHAQVPHVTIPTEDCGAYSDKDTFLHERNGPSAEQMPIKTMINEQEWKHLVIFYENDQVSSERVSSLMDTLETKSVTVMLYELPVLSQYINQLLSQFCCGDYKNTRFVVLAGDNITKVLLAQAEALGMTGDHLWLVQCSRQSQALLTLTEWMYRQKNTSSPKEGHQKTPRNSYIEQALHAINQTLEELMAIKDCQTTEETSNPTEKWTCTSPYSECFRKKIMSTLGVNLKSVVLPTVAQKDRFEMDGLDIWDPKDTLSTNTNNSVSQKTFVVTSIEYSFFQRKVPTGNGTFRWEGLTFQLLDEIAKDFDFNYKVVEPPDGKWGIDDGNGVWNGMIAQVINQDVDFAATCFSVIGARALVIDYAEPYFSDESAVIIKRPIVSGGSRMLLFLKPFRWQVWLGCILAVIVCGFVFWVLTVLSPHYGAAHGAAPIPASSRRVPIASLPNALFFMYGALIQQEYDWLPTAQSGRVFVGCFWFFCLVIAATYKGNLIAFLAVNIVELPFNTLSEMVQQSAISWGTEDQVPMVMLFRDADFEPYTSLYKGLDPVSGEGEGLRRVKEGDYAFIAEKSMYFYKANDDCDLAMIKETFYPTNYAWAFPKGSPLVQLFNDRIYRLKESGVLNHWTSQLTNKAVNCTGAGGVSGANGAHLIDIMGAILLLAIGIVVALLLLIGEHFIHRYLRRRRKQANILQIVPSKSSASIYSWK